MGEQTAIEWCDHTFNPWEGCTKVSPGCLNCYAENRNKRFAGGKNWGKGAPRRRTSVHNWNEPCRWDREAFNQWCAARGKGLSFLEPRRPRVFCASLADWLDDEVDVAWLADLLRLIRKTPHLDWLLLTKRPENWKERLDCVLDFEPVTADEETLGLSDWILDWYNGKPPKNVWIGTSAEDQPRADLRVPLVLKIPALVRFLSCEPMLARVEFSDVTKRSDAVQQLGKKSLDGIHWVICGGESGPGARPMHPDWARSLRDQCASAGVAFFFKQWGEWCPTAAKRIRGKYTGGGVFMLPDGRLGCQGDWWDGKAEAMDKLGKKGAGRRLDGKRWNQFPEART